MLLLLALAVLFRACLFQFLDGVAPTLDGSGGEDAFDALTRTGPGDGSLDAPAQLSREDGTGGNLLIKGAAVGTRVVVVARFRRRRRRRGMMDWGEGGFWAEDAAVLVV